YIGVEISYENGKLVYLQQSHRRAGNTMRACVKRIEILDEAVRVQLHSVCRLRKTSCAVSTELTSTFKPTKTRSMSATEIVISPAITRPRLSTWSRVSRSE